MGEVDEETTGGVLDVVEAVLGLRENAHEAPSARIAAGQRLDGGDRPGAHQTVALAQVRVVPPRPAQHQQSGDDVRPKSFKKMARREDDDVLVHVDLGLCRAQQRAPFIVEALHLVSLGVVAQPGHRERGDDLEGLLDQLGGSRRGGRGPDDGGGGALASIGDELGVLRAEDVLQRERGRLLGRRGSCRGGLEGAQELLQLPFVDQALLHCEVNIDFNPEASPFQEMGGWGST